MVHNAARDPGLGPIVNNDFVFKHVFNEGELLAYEYLKVLQLAGSQFYVHNDALRVCYQSSRGREFFIVLVAHIGPTHTLQ